MRPARQGCCGALPLHAGRIDQARALARHNIEVFEAAGVDRIAVNAAGCGSAMKEYGELFADDPAWAARAQRIQREGQGRDRTARRARRAARDPASAGRARRVSRRLSSGARAGRAGRNRARCCKAFPGVELLTPAESEICCGSAGIYNLVQPEPAAAARRAQSPAHRGALAGYDCHGQPRVHAADRRRGPRRRV